MTLADISARPRINALVEQLGTRAVGQDEELFESDLKEILARGNADGKFVFTASCSYLSIDSLVSAFRTALNLRNTLDTVIMQPRIGSQRLTFPGARCDTVDKDKWEGLYLRLRYTFTIGEVK